MSGFLHRACPMCGRAGAREEAHSTRRAEEIVAGELAASPEIKRIIEALLEARRAILDRIKLLDSRVRSVAKANATARLS